MSDLAKFLLKAYLRKVLTALGTYLITHDMLTGESDAFVSEHLDAVVGGLLIGGSTVWSTFYQWYVKRKVVAAKTLPVDASKEELEEAAKLAA